MSGSKPAGRTIVCNQEKRKKKMKDMASQTKPADGSSSRPIKITVVGDGTVGKTCILIAHTSGKFPADYIPTVFDNYAGSITVDGRQFNMTLWDTAGQEEYEKIRPLSYPHTDCFLLCFAVDNKASYDNIRIKWKPELHHYCPKSPILLVATKLDLRSVGAGVISNSEGRLLKKQIKAARYVECSAKTQEGLQQIFEEAIRASLGIPDPEKSKSCVLL